MNVSKYTAISIFCLTIACFFLVQFLNTDLIADKIKSPIRWFTRVPTNSERKDKSIWYDKNHDGLERIPIQMDFVPSRYSSILSAGKQPKVKLIVRYKGFGSIFYGGPEVVPGMKTFENCHVKHCSVTGDKNDISAADAMVFEDSPPLRKDNKFPSEQIWIIYAAESPMISGIYKGKAEFNWTSTYRHDSTIPLPTHVFVANNNSTQTAEFKNRNYASGRTKKVAWLSSHCSTSSKRESYIKELEKYISVDKYGRCGSRKCPGSKTCLENLSKDYKFYLSFENAKCRDYITEKFFKNAMSYDMLPVVLGAAPEDYARVAPPHSYINVEDFESPSQLAKYLHILDKNDALYNEYFRWKGTGTYVFKTELKFWCRLCALLHEADGRSRTWYTNFQQWWRGPGVCIGHDNWKDHPRVKTNSSHVIVVP